MYYLLLLLLGAHRHPSRLPCVPVRGAGLFFGSCKCFMCQLPGLSGPRYWMATASAWSNKSFIEPRLTLMFFSATLSWQVREKSWDEIPSQRTAGFFLCPFPSQSMSAFIQCIYKHLFICIISLQTFNGDLWTVSLLVVGCFSFKVK